MKSPNRLPSNYQENVVIDGKEYVATFKEVKSPKEAEDRELQILKIALWCVCALMFSTMILVWIKLGFDNTQPYTPYYPQYQYRK